MSKVFSEDRKREIGSRNLGGEEKEGILESFCQKNSAKLSEHPWGSTGCTAPTCSLCSKGIELQDCYVAHLAVLSVFYCSINNLFISLFPVIISSFFPIINPPLLNPLTNIQYSEMASSILPKEFLPFELKWEKITRILSFQAELLL